MIGDRVQEPWSGRRPSSVHALRERACLVAEEHLDLVAVDDPGDDTIAELLVAHEVALLEAAPHAVGLELMDAPAVERVLPALLVASCRRDARRARPGLAARGGAGMFACARDGRRAGYVRAPEVLRAAREALDLMSLSALHRDNSVV